MLEAPDGAVRLRPKVPVHLEALAGVAGQVPELELLLHTPNRITVATFLDGDHESSPRLWTNDPGCAQAFARLKGFDGGLCFGTEHAIDSDGVATRPQQVLQGLDGVVLVAVLDHGPGAKGSGHNVPCFNEE